MTESADYVDDREFQQDLVEYLKHESGDNWSQLVEKYPFEAKGNGRFVFLPSSHENVDNNSKTDFLVSAPQTSPESGIDRVSGDIYSELTRYMNEDDAVEKLDILAELEDGYDHTWISDDTVRFGPTPENGVTVSIPSLEEIAEAYNDTEEKGLGIDERDMLRTFASDSSYTVGTFSKTVYVQGDQIFVEDDFKDKFYQVESVGEALGLDEALDIYRMVREDERPDSGKEIFDNISKVFEAGEIDNYKLLIDSENQKVMFFDTDKIDMTVLGFEEANDWLADDEEDLVDRIDDFYRGLTQVDEA